MAMNFDTNVVVNTGRTLTVNGKNVITDEFSGATSSANGSKGYVPAPSSGDQDKFLKGDGTWDTACETVVFYGTSSTANNTSPKIVSISDEFYDASDIPSGTIVFVKFENSNTIYSTLALNINNTGNVYVCTMDAKTYGDAFKWDSGEMIPFVYDGVLNKWRILHYGVMKGATSSQSGEKGFVPAPAAGDQDKVLHGDGTWKDSSAGTFRVVPFSVGVSSWTLSESMYSCTFQTEYVTATSIEFVEYSPSFKTALLGDIYAAKASGGGGITFTTNVMPVGTLEGVIKVFDSNDNKISIVTQLTALPTLREVPFTLAVSDWTLNDNMYEAIFTTSFVTITSHDFVEFDESVENASAGIKVIKANVAGSIVGMKFISRSIPSGSISGIITPLDNADGKVAIALQDTVVPIANGGTGSNTLQGAQDNLGITALSNRFFPDPTNILEDNHSSAVLVNYTATEDCYFMAWITTSGTTTSNLKLNGVEVFASAYASVSSTVQGGAVSFFLKKGDVVTETTGVMRYIVMGLR